MAGLGLATVKVLWDREDRVNSMAQSDIGGEKRGSVEQHH